METAIHELPKTSVVICRHGKPEVYCTICDAEARAELARTGGTSMCSPTAHQHYPLWALDTPSACIWCGEQRDWSKAAYICPHQPKEIFGKGWTALCDGRRITVCRADGRYEYLAVPAMHPFDEYWNWPKTELYFVTMMGKQFAVVARTMREACAAIEEANGWN